MKQYTLIGFTLVIIVVIVTSKLSTDQCDLNDHTCFALADKTNWTINYVTSKQEYIELISQGESWIRNPYREKPGLVRREGVKVGSFCNLYIFHG